MDSELPAAALTRRAFLGSALAFGVPPLTHSHAQIAVGGLTPEHFGAAGDGQRDDYRAIGEAIAAAGARGVPLVFGEERRYALGAEGWRGIGIAVRAPIAIEGRSATLVLRARPRQSFAIGAGNPIIRFTGGAVTMRNLNFDLGGLDAAAVEFVDCALHVEGCGFANGSASNRSFGLYVNRSRGAIIANHAHNIGHFFYVGHTDPGWHSHDLRLADNRAQNLAADFVVGVIKNSTISDNIGDGMYSGLALAGFDRMRSLSENVTVTRNRFSNFRGNGIQTDVIGNIRLRNLVIRDNVIRSGIGPIASGIYLLRIHGFEAQGNTIEDSPYGVVLDAASNGSIIGNRIAAGVRGSRNGVMLAGDIGPVEDVVISENEVTGYDVGLASGGSAKGGVRRVRIARNRFRNGGYGISIVQPASEIDVSGNLLSGNRRGAITANGSGVRVGANQ